MAFFTIIIPTCNRPDLLLLCLERLKSSVQQFSSGALSYEVIVTDDSSNDITEKILLQEDWVRYSKGPGRGPAANRNNGASLAKGEWLIFIDDDCLPSVSLVQSYKEAISLHTDSLVFEGAIRAEGQKKRIDEEAPINENGGFLWSCNFAIQKAFFIKLGGFNEAFPYASMEDVDFYIRVQQKAIPIFVKEAFVVHPWRRVNNPALKYDKVFDSHKVFIQVNTAWKNYFTLYKIIVQFLVSFTKKTIPDLIHYKCKGWRMHWYYHVFQWRLLWHVLKLNNKS